MDVDEVDDCAASESVRLVMCEVCARNEAKYTCPRCEVRTCSLECVKIHKKELDCNGLRDKVKFKKLSSFNNIDLLNDYRLLEETVRLVSKSVKLPPVSCFNSTDGTLPSDLHRLRSAALSRGVHLHFLPPGFTRRETNTTHLNQKTQELFWRVDWVFHQTRDFCFPDERVLDSYVLSSCIHKFIDPDGLKHPAVAFYKSAGHSGVKILLKAERTSPYRYYLLDPSATLRQNLAGKHIIEYPVIFVVFNHDMHSYNVFTEEEEQAMRRKSRRRRYQNKNKTSFKSSCFFGENVMDVNENTSDLEDVPSTDPVSTTCNSPHYPYHKRRHFGRGRGRRRQFFRRSNSSTDRTINGSLSSNLNAIHI